MATTLSAWSATTSASMFVTGAGEVFSYEELDLKLGYAVLRFEGAGASEAFLPEAGGHRVQQVPDNEKHDRVHSSTITVAVLPEPASVDLRINPSDLRFEAYMDSGPGGQHRNKTMSAIRVTHIPTGLQACSATKHQHRNKELALAALRARIIEQRRHEATESRNANRRSQLGTGARSDKIRTIAYQRGRVESHVNGKRTTIKRYDRGFVDDLH